MMDKAALLNLTFEEAVDFYRDVMAWGDIGDIRWLCRRDRYFLMTRILGRKDGDHPWIYARCREVEREPEGYLDLWSRFHWKSSIITQAGSVQEILIDPNITIGIISNIRPLAKKFVMQIQRALERKNLFVLFEDILHEKPPRSGWSAEDGLIVKRTANPKEPTVMGAGLEALPTGVHWSLRIYDDIVTRESVGTPEQIMKTTEAWEHSLALCTIEGGREWNLGTRYHPDDTYSVMLARKALKERRRICYDSAGKSVLMDEDKLARLRVKMGERTFSSQMLQLPISAGTRMFKDEWFQTLAEMPARSSLNVYVIIDSANAKRKTSDYTTMFVIGFGRDFNYYPLDALRDKINLAERTRCLFDLVERWRPNMVFWEQQGLASDVEHVKLEQERIGWHFPITGIEQSVGKSDRIGWLVPLFEGGRIWFPNRILQRTVLGETYDFTHDFQHDEFASYPVCKHDDMLDCLANISHPIVRANARFPVVPREEGQNDKQRTKNDWKPW